MSSTATGKARMSRSTTRPTAGSRTCWSKCRSARSRWRWACSTTIPPRPSKARSIAQNAQASEGKKPDLQKLLSQGQTWMVEKQPHDNLTRWLTSVDPLAPQRPAPRRSAALAAAATTGRWSRSTSSTTRRRSIARWARRRAGGCIIVWRASTRHLRAKGSRLILRRGKCDEELAEVAEEIGASTVHAIRHYEPWWRKAERAVAKRLDLRVPRRQLSRAAGIGDDGSGAAVQDLHAVLARAAATSCRRRIRSIGRATIPGADRHGRRATSSPIGICCRPNPTGRPVSAGLDAGRGGRARAARRFRRRGRGL